MKPLAQPSTPAFVAALALVGLAACAGDSPGPPPTGPIPSVLIVNRSQYSIEELRIHRSADYLPSENLMPDGLEIDEEVLFYGLGEHWVTVIREKYQDGPMIAFTMARPMALYRGKGYKLSVFDEAFRLEATAYVDPDETSLPILGDPIGTSTTSTTTGP
ncbi:hypothetical protein L6R52_04045 [Myxococcota bacterium]|nr:hypothetical protein [Myxococcota bacterium]